MEVTKHELSRSPFVVGREPSCDIVLDYVFVSRRQLVFEAQDGRWRVKSTGRNPVSIGGRAFAEHTLLEPGTRVDIGPIAVVFDHSPSRQAELLEDSGGLPTVELSRAELLSRIETSSDRHLALLGQLIERVSGSRDADDIALCGARALGEAFTVRSSAVIELEGRERAAILASVGEPLDPIDRKLLSRALRQDAVVMLEEDRARRPLMIAALGPPMSGVLYAEREVGSTGFSGGDALFATVLAHLIASAIDASRRVGALNADKDRLLGERDVLQRDIARRGRFGALVGDSEPMRRLAAAIGKVAASEASVLVNGETGSGKELVAREIHDKSPRKSAPFFAINCASLPEGLVESELFGHKKGAFSGADADRRGVFDTARGGTLFLDEIAELPLSAQAKLLRVLDRKEVLPLGGTWPTPVDVRIVAATHRDLEKEVAAGRFRQDLYFRIKVFAIIVPPLRERLEDLPALIDHFFQKSADARRKHLRPPTAGFVGALMRHGFPGNVRELAHVVEHAAILADEGGALDVDALPYELTAHAPAPAIVADASVDLAPGDVSLREAVATYERSFILRNLKQDGWNRTKTARRLGISLRAFMDKLVRFELKGPGR